MDLLWFLYDTVPGRLLLKPLTTPRLSRLSGRILDHPASRILIAPFAARNGIDMAQFQEQPYGSFNEFFCRKIRSELRPVDQNPDHLASPCDGLLSVHPISQDLVLPVKQSRYTISSLLRSRSLAKRFEGGWCMVFRLCVNHYHRYIFPSDAVKSHQIRIDGVLHTVRPVALEAVPVFQENAREYCVLQTPRFGTVIQMEVGAMLVGRICNFSRPRRVYRGQEKGLFQYGGSTIILLVQKDRVRIPQEFLGRQEVPVLMGQMIAETVPRPRVMHGV